MYSGNDSINYLSKEIARGEDKSASSHWRKYHESFRFIESHFEGLVGFGGNCRPRFFIFRLLERLMQLRFRKMGGINFHPIDQLAQRMALKQSRTYDLDLLRQSLTVSFLQTKVPDAMTPKSTACVIGDGFSSMTSLMLLSKCAGRVILINLNKTLLVDLWYLKLWMGEDVFAKSVDLVVNKVELDKVLSKQVSLTGNVIAIQAVNQDLLKYCSVDLVINIASMQEMDPPIIYKYFESMRAVKSKRTLFYCCNRVEKELPDGTVTKFEEYPWCPADEIIVDELCPWHQEFYSFRPPFFRKYDGPIQHRLVTLASKKMSNESNI